MTDDLEVRHLDGVRAVPGDAPRLVGYAIRTNVLSEDLGGFRERIAPDALRAALAVGPDLVALRNHDAGHVLGRMSAKTLRVEADDQGLRFEIDMPSHAGDLVESVQRGDVTGASFAFRVPPGGDAWDMSASPPVRTVRAMELREISVGVLWPAYRQAHVAALRSLEHARHQETPPMEPTVTVTEPVPPVPPVVTESRDVPPADTEVRVLSRDQSVRAWVEARSRSPREFASLRLGDVMRAMIAGPRTDLERRALSEGTDSAGGYTVPDIVLSRFIDRLRAAIVCIRAGAATVPLTSDVTRIARLATDPTAAWRSENAAVSESDPAFETLQFTARSLDVQMKVSRELVEDSLNIAEMLETALLRSFAVEVDRVCLHGTGTAPQPRGLRNITGVGEVSMGANGAALTNHDKLLDTLAELWTDNVMTPTGLVHAPRTATTIEKFKDTTNQPLQRPAALTAFPWYQTTSMPVTETQGTAGNASSVFIGDFTQMMLGFRTEMQIEVARELHRGNYQFGFFGHLRMDVQVQHPESFARLIGIIP